MNSDHNINVQRLLLLSKGYTEGHLHRENEPRLFLTSLQAKIQELNRRTQSTNKAQSFALELQGDFENGSFPVLFVFGYQYNPSDQSLSMKYLEAHLFDAEVYYHLSKQVLLPTAAAVLKDLKSNLRRDMNRRVNKSAGNTKIPKR